MILKDGMHLFKVNLVTTMINFFKGISYYTTRSSTYATSECFGMVICFYSSM